MRIQSRPMVFVLAVASYGYAQTIAVPAQFKADDTFKAKPETKLPCWLIPTRYSCMNAAGYADSERNKFINDFYRTSSNLSYFNQVKSIYNRASGSATVSADLTSLNFADGMQINAGTNIQAGASTATPVSTATVPTLSSTSAAQAAQDMLYGGTLYASVLYPLVAIGVANVSKAGGFGMRMDLIGREGVDIQNFKSGTNTSVTSPPSHTSAQIEGYLQYNSTNSADASSGTGTFAGAVFVGGAYGYSYTSHDYARDYGLGNNVHNGVGQVSLGILINNVATISASRAFGPSQTYIDSTSMTQVRVDNFKSWSVGISYQSPPPKASN